MIKKKKYIYCSGQTFFALKPPTCTKAPIFLFTIKGGRGIGKHDLKGTNKNPELITSALIVNTFKVFLMIFQSFTALRLYLIKSKNPDYLRVFKGMQVVSRCTQLWCSAILLIWLCAVPGGPAKYVAFLKYDLGTNGVFWVQLSALMNGNNPNEVGAVGYALHLYPN
jgi:hypothetical protein